MKVYVPNVTFLKTIFFYRMYFFNPVYTVILPGICCHHLCGEKSVFNSFCQLQICSTSFFYLITQTSSVVVLGFELRASHLVGSPFLF
jgi:hypothetical protein